MSSLKQRGLKLSDKHYEMAQEQSKDVLGKSNVSGYYRYLLEREDKKRGNVKTGKTKGSSSENET